MTRKNADDGDAAAKKIAQSKGVRYMLFHASCDGELCDSLDGANVNLFVQSATTNMLLTTPKQYLTPITTRKLDIPYIRYSLSAIGR